MNKLGHKRGIKTDFENYGRDTKACHLIKVSSCLFPFESYFPFIAIVAFWRAPFWYFWGKAYDRVKKYIQTVVFFQRISNTPDPSSPPSSETTWQTKIKRPYSSSAEITLTTIAIALMCTEYLPVPPPIISRFDFRVAQHFGGRRWRKEGRGIRRAENTTPLLKF